MERLFLKVGKTESGGGEDEAHTSVSPVIIAITSLVHNGE